MGDISTSFKKGVNLGDTTNAIAQVFGELRIDNEVLQYDKANFGNTDHLGDGEWLDLVQGNLNYLWKDNDNDGEISEGDTYLNEAHTILREVLLGDGIAGVKLIGLDGDSFTLQVDGAEGVNYMVFEGKPAQEAIALVDAEQGLSAGAGGFDLNPTGNVDNQFAILDLSDPAATLKVGEGGDLGPVSVGNDGIDAGDVATLVNQVLLNGGYSGVELIDVDKDSIALGFSGNGGSTDTLLITGIGATIGSLEGSDLHDLINNFGVSPANDFEINGGSFTPDNVGSPDGDLFAKLEIQYGVDFGTYINNNTVTKFDDNNLLDILVAEGGQVADDDETLTLVGVDSDSFTFSYNANGATDYFVFDYEVG